MKQLLILSGKGGTGKTTVAGAFIALSGARAYADCDVDAPNLHLIAGWSHAPERADYYGMAKAAIDPDKCVGCGACLAHCRFDAVEIGPTCRIKPYACEGCGVCAAVCPAGAIAMTPAKAGTLALFREPKRVFSTAKLRMGEGASGKLVTAVKSRLAAAAGDAPLAVIDGSPGIGCPVIASISGAHLVLVVAEPSLSGLSDMARILETAAAFRTPAAVCVNKADLNPEKTREIQAWCAARDIPFVGTLPYDPEAVRAINSGRTITEVACPAGEAVRAVWERTEALLNAE